MKDKNREKQGWNIRKKAATYRGFTKGGIT
jgi:hypothetical protein